MDPRAVQTNGVGQRTTAHLNLTRSLADVGWPDTDHGAGLPLERPYVPPPHPGKRRFSGYEAPKPTGRFRLRYPDRSWLHMSGTGKTLVRNDGWIGTGPQFEVLKQKHPELASLEVVL